MKVRTTNNFEFLLDNFNKYRGIGLPGGTRSAKSISAMQFIGLKCFESKGKEIIIGRDTLANLKKTTLNDFKAVCYGQKGIDPLYPKLRIYDEHSNPRCEINGNLINFFGLNDDIMRTHGMDSDIFYLNEAVAIKKYCYNQLNQRCREGYILDWNPSEPNSWCYELESRDDVVFNYSSYLDNPFLSKAIVDEIEAYCPWNFDDLHLPEEERRPNETNINRKTADKKMWTVYGKGEIHRGKEIIFPEWKIYKDEPESYDYKFYGLDWGWNDPLAFMEITIVGNKLYIKELLYGSEIKPETYIPVILDQPLLKSQKVYLVCDNSEPKSITELRSKNISAVGAKKPKGSIMDGINQLNRYQIFIHEDSHNCQREANTYKYKVDSKTGLVLDVPIDKNNHCWDAVRYPVQMFLDNKTLK